MKIKYTTKEPELRVGMEVSIDVDNINFSTYNKMYNIGGDFRSLKPMVFKVVDLKGSYFTYPAVEVENISNARSWYIPKELLIIKSK